MSNYSASPPIDNEPAFKKVRLDNKLYDGEGENSNIQMDTNQATILEWLNRDVLRIVLDYLCIEDILSSITVSRKWRDQMLEYLKDSHYCFEYYSSPRFHFIPRLLGLVNPTDVCKRRSTPFDMSHGHLQKIPDKIRDLGPGIVSIILSCFNKSTLRAITENCPNLMDLMLIGMPEHPAHESHESQSSLEQQQKPDQCNMLSVTEELQQCLKNLQLKRVTFLNCTTVMEGCLLEEYIGEFLKCDSVEELVVYRPGSVEGHYLSYLSQKKEDNLKSLRLVGCPLKPRYLESVADHLTNLTMLDLSNHASEVLENVHLLLRKTSKLEYLFLNCYYKGDVGEEFVESLRGLGCLKHLSLCWNDNVCDEWLEAVAQGCPALQSFDIESKNAGMRPGRWSASGHTAAALCRAAPALAHAGLAGHGGLTDAELRDILASCHKLQSLDLRGCARIAEDGRFLSMSAPRPAPVRLLLARTAASRLQMQAPKGLTFDFVDAPRLFRLL